VSGTLKSKFYLVDLSGSHKHHSKTKAEALSREEIKINLDFLTLGNIIGTLGEDNSTNKLKHVNK
jgi:hypothetical protein